jgi:hypothetical protein
MNEFAIFRRFSNSELAVEMAEELAKYEIESQLIDDSPSVDITFTGISELQKETQLMIQQSDFEKAENILEEKAVAQINDIADDYYLFDFTNEELNEIIEKPDEWNSFDYKLAQKLLKDRGQLVDENYLKSLKEQRIIDLAKPEEEQRAWIIFAYILSVLGGLLGVVIGWYLWTMKKTLPDGQKIYVYSSTDRLQGKRIFFLGIIIFSLEFLIALLYKLNLI